MRGALVAVLLYILLLTLNRFRLELFGIVPGYAPHNFVFNMLVFLPGVVIILVTCALVIGNTIRRWKSITLVKNQWIPLLLTVPIFTLILLRFVGFRI